eukprot:SAG31_NODE_2113_length_6422_cov_2.860035_3_plen_69_part_00
MIRLLLLLDLDGAASTAVDDDAAGLLLDTVGLLPSRLLSLHRCAYPSPIKNLKASVLGLVGHGGLLQF